MVGGNRVATRIDIYACVRTCACRVEDEGNGEIFMSFFKKKCIYFCRGGWWMGGENAGFDGVENLKKSVEFQRKGLHYQKIGVNCRDRGLYRDVLSTGLYRVIR